MHRPFTLQRSLLLSAAFLLPAAARADADYENTTARFQATYIRQNKPAFNADYSGPNSLDAAKAMSYTATATGYFGFRPWSGGEFYVNPEVTQGVPFSDLQGSAAFTNGELTRTASRKPHLYRQRIFLRQTWNQGGGEMKIDSDLNQMAGTVDRNRIVLTVGNFSTLDVFDDNRYAKDPRVQFMNAGFMTYLAYDYAADARGFGVGFAAEWYRDDWVLRLGRMSGPKDPNMLPTDFQIGKHYGDQIELQHNHSLFGQPGAVRVLAWRNRARLARFADALDYLRGNPGADPQAIFAVRSNEQIKYGIGINLEQAVNADLGVFLRAMKADGRSETLAFTETDNSISAGAVLQGTAWGRSRDSVGVGVLRNGISAARRNYLEAGGISFFLGDGALRYRSEQLVEAFYSAHVWRDAFVTLDLQRMWNPAYNADRGPANFAALRLHAEF